MVKRVSKKPKLTRRSVSGKNAIDCEIAHDYVKLTNEVWNEILARMHTVAHKPTSAQRMTFHEGTLAPNNRLWSPANWHEAVVAVCHVEQ